MWHILEPADAKNDQWKVRDNATLAKVDWGFDLREDGGKILLVEWLTIAVLPLVLNCAPFTK